MSSSVFWGLKVVPQKTDAQTERAEMLPRVWLLLNGCHGFPPSDLNPLTARLAIVYSESNGLVTNKSPLSPSCIVGCHCVLLESAAFLKTDAFGTLKSFCGRTDPRMRSEDRIADLNSLLTNQHKCT